MSNIPVVLHVKLLSREMDYSVALHFAQEVEAVVALAIRSVCVCGDNPFGKMTPSKCLLWGRSSVFFCLHLIHQVCVFEY